jgi:hypothetical protein
MRSLIRELSTAALLLLLLALLFSQLLYGGPSAIRDQTLGPAQMQERNIERRMQRYQQFVTTWKQQKELCGHSKFNMPIYQSDMKISKSRCESITKDPRVGGKESSS